MITFPALPTYRAEWYPLQFETIPGSGERFTFAIVARGEDGKADIRDVLRPGILKTMYPKQGDLLQGLMIRYIIAIKDHLSKQGDWRDIPIPMSNVFAGPTRPTLADDLEQVFDQAIRLSAGLGHSTIGERVQTEVDVDAEIKSWASRVKEFAMVMNDTLKPFFNHRVVLNDPRRPKAVIGFMTDRYAASFGVIHARSDRISTDITVIKRRLWDLGQLKFDQLIGAQERELIVGHPAFELIERNQPMRDNLIRKLETLRAEAANFEIGVVEATTPMEAADYLVKKVVNQ